MVDFRAELQALVAAYDEHGGRWPQHHEDALLAAVERARAALAAAQGEAGAKKPSDDDLGLIYHDCCRGCEFMDQGGFEDAARAVLARWGRPAQPAPPAEGEVAELIERLKYAKQNGCVPNGIRWGLADGTTHYGSTHIPSKHGSDCGRAAELLAQAYPPAPVPEPVPVSERLPQPEDCAPLPDDPDVEPWCWAGVIVDDGWEWHQRSSGIFTFTWPSHTPSYTHWLPASALPLPSAEVPE